MVNEPSLDPQRLAALLDGRLSPPERAEMLARLAASEEDLALLADATAIMHELDQGGSADRPTTTSKPDGRGRGWWPARGWLALAAALAIVSLVPLIWSRRATSDEADPGRFVALLERPVMPRADASLQPSSSRGPADTLDHNAAAIRLGMRLADLELAIRAGDTTASTSAAAVAVLLDELGAGLLATRFRNLSDSTTRPAPTDTPALRRLRIAAMRSTGTQAETLVELGAWLATARAAIAARDARFFHSTASRRLLDHAVALRGLSPRARNALSRLRKIAQAEELSWNDLERDLSDAIAAVVV